MLLCMVKITLTKMIQFFQDLLRHGDGRLLAKGKHRMVEQRLLRPKLQFLPAAGMLQKWSA
jgi:hypothetical protein